MAHVSTSGPVTVGRRTPHTDWLAQGQDCCDCLNPALHIRVTWIRVTTLMPGLLPHSYVTTPSDRDPSLTIRARVGACTCVFFLSHNSPAGIEDLSPGITQKADLEAKGQGGWTSPVSRRHRQNHTSHGRKEVGFLTQAAMSTGAMSLSALSSDTFTCKIGNTVSGATICTWEQVTLKNPVSRTESKQDPNGHLPR